MTKKIRIENADTGTFIPVVQVWAKPYYAPGEDQSIIKPDHMVREIELSWPTYQLEEYIHSSQYIVVKEKEIKNG